MNKPDCLACGLPENHCELDFGARLSLGYTQNFEGRRVQEEELVQLGDLSVAKVDFSDKKGLFEGGFH